MPYCCKNLKKLACALSKSQCLYLGVQHTPHKRPWLYLAAAWLLGFGLWPGGQVHQLAQLPVLLAHYQHHLTEHSNTLHFADFLAQHYADDHAQHDGSQHDHSQLPLHQFTGCGTPFIATTHLYIGCPQTVASYTVAAAGVPVRLAPRPPLQPPRV